MPRESAASIGRGDNSDRLAARPAVQWESAREKSPIRRDRPTAARESLVRLFVRQPPLEAEAPSSTSRRVPPRCPVAPAGGCSAVPAPRREPASTLAQPSARPRRWANRTASELHPNRIGCAAPCARSISRAERQRRGLTQERVAELADLHMTDVGRIERADRDPGVRTIAKLAAGLRVPASRLLEGIPDEPTESEPT